ncbi:MAG: thiamine pyrophosphate-binding protein [Gemmatimonadales bacterium]|nr:thiamine pyrophosphate-binding protein [Gemmatimonadales bacterium]
MVRQVPPPGALKVFAPDQVVALLRRLGITHVVTVPDSTLGPWAETIVSTPGVRLIRVCREGEAWAVAGGLHLGGATPLVVIQCTGLFESGDALRNVLHDWKLPIPAVIGYRSYLNQETLPGDTCLVFTEPILDAWGFQALLITEPDQFDAAVEHLFDCRAAGTPGVALIAEGKA